MRYEFKQRYLLNLVRFLTLFFSTLCVTSFTVVPPAAAESSQFAKSIIRLGTSYFDLRVDVEGLRRDNGYIPISSIAWLHDFISDIPATRNVVFHIELVSQGTLNSWPSPTPDKDYPITEGIRAEYLIPGFTTRAVTVNNRSVLIFPTNSPNDFFVLCGGYGENVPAACALYATYAPDPNIRLKARIYTGGKPDFRFEEIADIIRKVAYCLDVTSTIDDTDAQEPSPQLEAGAFDIDECEAKVAS